MAYEPGPWSNWQSIYIYGCIIGQVSPAVKPVRNLPWNIGCRRWCRLYFWEGQTLQGAQTDLDDVDFKEPIQEFVRRYRRLLAICIPASIVQIIWWVVFIRYDLFHLFPDRYELVVTMVIASVLAGLTSIGASAVAFPVMTLILHVTPVVARDFGIVMQAMGLSCAVCTVTIMGVQMEWNAIAFCSLGGAFGVIFGLEVVEHRMSPALKKMTFASFWFSFAFALFLLNRNRGRRTFSRIYLMNWWKALVLIICGVVGGLFGSFVGSGIDICSLSILTLFFRLSEKSATPTSLAIIASNSIVAVIWRQGLQSGISLETWQYVLVTAEVGFVGAPIGSLIGAHFHRQVIAWCIIFMVTLTLITSFALVPQTPVLVGVSIGVIALGAIVFALLTYAGQKIMLHIESKAKEHGTTKALQEGTEKPQEKISIVSHL